MVPLHAFIANMDLLITLQEVLFVTNALNLLLVIVLEEDKL